MSWWITLHQRPQASELTSFELVEEGPHVGRRRQAESSKRCHVGEPPRHSRSKLHHGGGRGEVPRTEWFQELEEVPHE